MVWQKTRKCQDPAIKYRRKGCCEVFVDKKMHIKHESGSFWWLINALAATRYLRTRICSGNTPVQKCK